MKGMVVLVAYTQVNVSARESNVTFDDTQTMISKMREVVSYPIPYGRASPGGECVFWGAPVRGMFTGQHGRENMTRMLGSRQCVL